MKSFIASLVLAASVSAVAAPDTAINDLQYLPNAGTLWGSTQYAHFKFTGGKQNVIAQRVGYSFVDNFFLDAGVNYSGGDAGSNKGFGDVDVNGRYRLSGSSANRLDIVGNLSVSPGDSEVKSNGDSNAYTGGHAAKIGVEYGNKTSERQWSLGAYYTHLFEQTTKFKGGGGTDKADAHEKISFGANLLTKITDTSYFKTFGFVDFEQDYDTDSDTGDFETPGSTLWRIGGEYQYLCSKDLYLGLSATNFNFGNSSSPTAMQYTATASYQF